MKMKLDRIVSVATLGSSLIAIWLVLKKPQPIAPPQTPAAIAAHTESLENKLQELNQPKQPGEPPTQVRLTSEEVGAALAQAAGALTTSAVPASAGSSPAGLPTGLTTTVPSSADAPIAPGEPEVKDYQVNFDGDVARGQFVTQIGGKTVYVTLAGHLGSKGGYATFDPTEFKVGDMSIPVSLVNDALQKKLAEQRDRLKLPDDVSDMHVENGQLVMTSK
jgi:hypothetical protein